MKKNYLQSFDGLTSLHEKQFQLRTQGFHPSETFEAFKKKDIEQSIPDRFEQQAKKHPTRLAIKTSACTMTYCELNEAANRVAHSVLHIGDQPQEPVVLLTASDEKLVLATLGVLKAGYICMPFSLQAPKQLAFMLQQSRARLIVTDTSHISLAETLHTTQKIFNIDDIASDVSSENPGVVIESNWLAYILYTSGSTGQAKGVMHSHQNILHIVRDNTNSLFITCDDRLASFSANGFIGSLAAIFRALLNGAALFPFDLQHETVMALSHWLNREAITLVQTVPSIFRSLANTLSGEGRFPHLRVVHLAGEQVTKQDLILFKKIFPQTTTLLNELGTTETGAIRRLFIDHSTKLQGDIVPVGYAIEDKEVLLLDQTGQEVYESEVGEIAVKSHYLAQGYWYQPTLTQKVFSRAPERTNPCIYHTGDLGRRRPDGCLEYLGRKDFQIKIRGRLVDVATIELSLKELDGINDVVVVGHDNPNGCTVLVAYVVLSTQRPTTYNEMRRALKKKVSREIIPNRFVQIKAIPLTPTGKVDRRALPVPDQKRPELDEGFVTPSTPTEIKLTEIWKRLLGITEIGVHDNFFELGGHSLLATQIISRIRKFFSIEIPLRSLFENPTLAELAEKIDTIRWVQESTQDSSESLLDNRQEGEV